MSQHTTSHKQMPIGVRIFALITAGAFLFTSLGAAPAEASFWEERAAARSRQIQGASAPMLLAQLPVSQPLSFGGTAQTVLPSFSPKLSTLLSTAPRWAQGAVTSFADIRSVREGASGSLRVFLVMDAHDVYSAQRNIARLLAHLGKQGKMLVGIEGTSGAFDLERHRGLLPGAGQGQLVNHLLKKGFLNGPEAFGLTAEKTPDFWGVEDAALYDANVQAYRDTLSIEAETQSALQKLKKETSERQAKLFSPELQALEREVQAMHEDRGDLGKYVKAVLEGAGEVRPASQVRRFVEAKSKEDSLSFPAVEQARAAFIERVSPRLSPFELEALVKKTTAFRAGSVSAKDYYRDLVSVALSKGVPVSAYPAFQSYIEYVSLTDGLDVVALMDEMEEIEGRAYGRLAKGDARPLAEWSKDLRLAERAVQHAMTPREWTQYEERRGELARLADRAVSLGMSQDSAEVAQKNLPRFAAFFEAATARNHTLLENALAQAHQRGATTVVLVTGGFHAPALEKLLNQKNISHMVLSPRIEEVPDSAAGYLGAFAPTRTPLEKLLLGDRLFMNPPSATAASVANPGDPFNESAVALTRASMAYGTALAGFQGKLAEFLSRWNNRFGRAVARVVKKGSVDLVEVRFAGTNDTALLVALANEANVSGDSLSQAVEAYGGTVVEAGKISDAPYVLGGKNLSRFIPELMGGAAFLAWLGGSALAPPALMVLVGFVAWAILGGMTFRGLLLATTYWHGLGHALLARALGGQSVRVSLGEYSKNLPWAHIVPGKQYFLPWFTPSKDAPRFEVTSLPGGWRTRLTALAGPVMNLIALAFLFPVAMAADPVSAQQLVLGTAAGLNLWAIITSKHDIKSAFSGFATFFACGVVSGRFVISNPDSEAIPNFVEAEVRQSFVHTTPRGFQGGGVGFIVKRILEDGTVVYEIVVSKRAKEWDRRELSSDMLNDVMERLNQKARDGNYEGDDVVAFIGHSRLGTNDAEQEERNAHPFTSQVRLQPIAYIGNKDLVPQSEKYWLPPKENPVLKITTQNRGVLAAANGDDNKTVLTVVPVTFDQTSHSYVEGSEIVYMSNGEDALLSEYLTGVKNVADGDSPQIPTRLDRWTSIGSVRDSLRLALSQVGFDYLGNHYQRYANIQQGKGIEFPFSTIQQFQPSPERVSALMLTKVMDMFHQQVEGLVSDYASVSNLRELYAKLGAVVEDPGQGSDPKKVGKVWNLGDAVPLKAGSEIETLRNQLAKSAKGFLTSMEWFNEASDADQERYSVLFADLFLKFYFTQDFRSAGINFLRRADLTSTYGVAALSLSQPKDPMWMCLRQDYYLWVTEDGKNVTGTSASKAHLRQREGGARFRYRLTMRDGEVATLNGRKLVIDHMDQGRVAEFDLDNLAAEQNGDSLVNMKSRWLDLDHSPFVKRTTGEVTPHEERTLTDFKMIPKVEAGISEDFKDKGRGKNSNNRLSGLAFVKLVLAAKKKLRRGTASVDSLDLVIVGLEKSFDAGDLFRKAVLKLASMAGRPLKVEIINAAEFAREDLVSLRDKGFGPETVVLGLSSSGQTANTMYVLNNLHDAWRFLLEKNETGSSGGKTPPHFLVSADMDNAYTENVLGQGYHEGDPFLARNFVTFPGNLDSFHPSEASTVTDKATRFLLNELLLLTAIDLDRVKKRREGQGSNVRSLSAVVHSLLAKQAETNREIVGVDENDRTMPIKSSTVGEKDIPEQVEIVKNRLKQRFLETLWGVVVAAPLFVTLTLVFHQTPASLLMGGWFPNALFVFADGLPVLAVIVGVVGVAVAYWKARAWKWNWPFQVLGVVMVSCVSLLGGEVVVVGLNAISQSLGWGLWGSRWGVLPIILDVSPINLLNILSYIFFTFGFIHLLRWIQKRPTIDRLGPMVLVFSDYEKSTGRSISRLYQRLYSLRYGWMGPSSTNFSSEGEFTHGELNNSGGRGTIVVHGEGRGEESSGASKNKNIAGGLPKGRGAKILQIGVGHRPHSEGIANYDLYISLFKEGDDISERDPDVAALQEYIYDAQVRHTVLMRLGVVITDEISNIRPLNFPTGTANEASASTTAQPKSLIPTEVVERIFNVNEITATRKGPNSRDFLNSLAEFLGLTEFSNLSMPDLKKEIREALKSREVDASPIPGVHEEALLSALAGKVGGATAVRIRLGNGSEDPSVTIAKYRKLRNSGQLGAPESLIVGFTGTEGFVVHLVPLSVENGDQQSVPSRNVTDDSSVNGNEPADSADDVAGEEANTGTEQGGTESPKPHETDLAGLKALAYFLGIPSSDPDTSSYLKGQIRANLLHRKQADIPSIFIAPLLEVLKGAPEAYRSRVSVPEGNSNNSLRLHDISARSQEFPKGPSYRVTHDKENVFHLSLSPLEAVRVEENPSRPIPVPWGGVAQPREALAVIDVSRDASHATEEKPSGGVAEEARWQEFNRTYILKPLLKIARVTMIVTGLFLIAGDQSTHSLSRAISNSVTSMEVGNLPNSSLITSIPSNAPRAFVITKQTPLMSFDRSPSEKNRVVERVGARSSVKIVERKGNWVLVSTLSGKQGWVKARFLEKGTGERTRVVQGVALLEHTPPLRMANLPRGAALAVLETQGKWAKVVPVQNSASPVWVSQEYISNAPPEQSSKVKAVPPGVKVDSSRAGTILLPLGKPVPVLGQMARRALDAIGSQNSPGFVLHQRLLAGSLREFKAGPTREMAEALVSFVDHPGTSSMDSVELQMVLALGYGAVAGKSWSQAGAPKDRALYDDYRRTRTAISRGALSASAGRALTRLARRASGWKLSTTPTFAPGALPVIDLSEEGQNSSLISQWAAAVARGDRYGEPAPVMVARNERQKAQLLAALKEWLIAHEEIKLSDEAIDKSPWVFLDHQEGNVVLRDGEGNPQTVRLGAMLNVAHINLEQITAGIDVVSRPGTSLTWDRSDVPQNIAVRLLIGLLKTISLSAPLEEAQGALRSARKAQTAA